MLRPIAIAYGRALRSQFSSRMLLLSVVPLLLSLALWGSLLYAGMQPLYDWLQATFSEYGLFETSSSILATLGLGFLKTLVVPLVAMLALLPLMIITSLLFIGVGAMPAIARHVSRVQFPQLERKEGGSFLGSLGVNLSGIVVFALLWIVTLPLYALAPVALLVQAVLWGWLTARVMSYDALSIHASLEERRIIVATRRRQLLLIGTISGLLGALPGVAWIGGALLSVVLFPVLAVLSIWLYLIIFIFTGLWFQYYCLQALLELRAAQDPLKAPE
ncbi:EI24 domain-containing protein [Massilia norwichensis]|jgi:Etoposide-induced protein 2.4 (EI24)|uniref:EI24 domain-containing protein n=1 Tax=Massilia norwichensis TaxID=1442366 RepID=A0ABT2AEL5_9BURK|nr:EI24 domain-containing protein [Massilia norwichensis]MCS0592200.1 EI24 domain-containing protein [Massilia norwichensis]